MAEAAPGASRTALKRTPLFELHRGCGARMVAFAGYEMPVRYAPGIIAEHRHTRAAARLFDVSHLGRAALGAGAWDSGRKAAPRCARAWLPFVEHNYYRGN